MSANAGIIIPAGEWTVDIGGNVNTFYTHTTYSGAAKGASGSVSSESTNTLQTGLLPTALGIGAKTRQNDLDVAVQFSLFTGVNANGTDQLNVGNAVINGNGGLGYNSLNIRQAYLSFGDKSWGSFTLGRNLGVFGSDAILSDMTLAGVGSNGGSTGSSTLGRIGSGYTYADWLAQISYSTPNFSGFEATGSVHEVLGSIDNSNLGVSGKASYSFAANDASGKVWVGATHKKMQVASGLTATYNTSGITITNTGNVTEYDSEGFEVGGKVAYAGAELVGYYYNGKNMDSGIGTAINTASSATGTSNITADLDNKGGYVQLTYVLPVKTKVGASWGKNIIETSPTHQEREAWIVGAYHPLTKHLNLVAEYNHQTSTNQLNQENKANSGSLGAILFF